MESDSADRQAPTTTLIHVRHHFRWGGQVWDSPTTFKLVSFVGNFLDHYIYRNVSSVEDPFRESRTDSAGVSLLEGGRKEGVEGGVGCLFSEETDTTT